MIYNGFGISVNKCINEFYQIEIYQQCAMLCSQLGMGIWLMKNLIYSDNFIRYYRAHRVVYMDDKKLELVPLRLSKENILRASRGRVEPIIFLL